MSGLRARVWLNLALLSLALGLVAVIWLGPSREPPPAERLSAIDPTTVKRVRIERRRANAIELHRGGAGWRLVSPRSLPANDHRVSALLGFTAAKVHEAFRAEGNDLDAFGLDPPVARLILDENEFLFGDTDPLNGWRYILHGPDVHLVTDAYFHHLLATPAAFVDPAPIAAGSEPVAFVLPGGQRLERDNGIWHADPGLEGPSADSANRLADAWKNARAASVKAFDPALAWSQALEVLVKGEPEPLVFKVARLEHEMVLGRVRFGVQYHFPLAAGKRLLELPVEVPAG